MYRSSTNNNKFNKREVERLNFTLSKIQEIYSGNLVEILVFGSYAKGTAKKFSSIDLLVVVRNTEERFVRRNADLQKCLNDSDDLPLIDPLVYTQAELMELVKKKESFIISVLKESIVIWNDFNDIALDSISEGNIVPSRFRPTVPKLGEIEY